MGCSGSPWERSATKCYDINVVINRVPLNQTSTPDMLTAKCELFNRASCINLCVDVGFRTGMAILAR